MGQRKLWLLLLPPLEEPRNRIRILFRLPVLLLGRYGVFCFAPIKSGRIYGVQAQ